MKAKITENPEYNIRYSTIGDLGNLRGWLEREEARRWYPISSYEDGEMIAKNWIGFSRFQASLTATYEEKPIGIATLFLMPYKKVMHLCPFFLIISSEFQNRGVGTSLVRNIGHLAKTRFHLEKIYVELYEGCPAIHLLKRAGYQEIFRQEKVVKEGNFYLAKIAMEKQLGQRDPHQSEGS